MGWLGHVTDWVKCCTMMEVEGVRLRGRQVRHGWKSDPKQCTGPKEVEETARGNWVTHVHLNWLLHWCVRGSVQMCVLSSLKHFALWMVSSRCSRRWHVPWSHKEELPHPGLCRKKSALPDWSEHSSFDIYVCVCVCMYVSVCLSVSACLLFW